MTDRLWMLDSVSLAGRPAARLDGVSVTLVPGTTAIVGYSGAGKTALLNLLVGFEQSDSGRVTCHIGAMPDEPARLPVFWVPQDDGLWPRVTVRDHLELVAPEDRRETASGLLDDFDLTHVAEAFPDRLSRGEASRLAVARAIASDAVALVLDEPLAHVDPARRTRYWDRLIQFAAERPASILFASHEPADVLRYSEQVIGLFGGRVIYEGETTALYERPPDERAAVLLGPTNWFEQADRNRWQVGGANGSPCIRPEWLTVDEVDDGAASVVRSRCGGPIVESDLRCHSTGEVRRVIHRPNRRELRPGAKVRLTVLTLLMAAFPIAFASGCDASATGPELEIVSETQFALPADETSLPAPRDITVGQNDEKIILDNAGRVLVYGAADKLIRQWEMPDSAVGNPEGACVLADGRICVADTHYHQIVYFDAEGTVVGKFGELGRGPGQFIYPVAVTTDPAGNLYVAEYGSNDRIQKFSPDDEYLTAFGSFGTEAGQFQRPSGLVWLDGNLYVVDAFNSRVHVFSDSGEYRGLLGSAEVGLHYPYDLALGPDGHLYIAEYGSGRITVLSTDGEIVGRFGTTGSGRGQFATPWGLAVDSVGRIWVADTGNRRVVEIVPQGSKAATLPAGAGGSP